MKFLSNWKWILAVAAALALFLSSGGTRSYWQRKKYLEELRAKLEKMRKDNKQLTMEVNRLQHEPRAIEQHARRDLGMIQPGEMEYRFVVYHSSLSKKETPAP